MLAETDNAFRLVRKWCVEFRMIGTCEAHCGALAASATFLLYDVILTYDRYALRCKFHTLHSRDIL